MFDEGDVMLGLYGVYFWDVTGMEFGDRGCVIVLLFDVYTFLYPEW